MSTEHTPQLQNKKPGAGALWDDVWRSQHSTLNLITIGRRVYNRLFLGVLAPRLSASTTMIELGCGTASLGRLIAPHIKEYTGIDSSRVQVQITQKACAPFGNMHILARDLYDDTPHETYDLVWSQGLLEHFADGKDLVEKHIAHCKPGGTVVISVPRSGSYLEWWYRCTRPKFLRMLWPWTDQRFFSAKDLESIMHEIPQNLYSRFSVMKMKPSITGIILLTIETQVR